VASTPASLVVASAPPSPAPLEPLLLPDPLLLELLPPLELLLPELLDDPLLLELLLVLSVPASGGVVVLSSELQPSHAAAEIIVAVIPIPIVYRGFIVRTS
jgi:hypothetical protein